MEKSNDTIRKFYICTYLIYRRQDSADDTETRLNTTQLENNRGNIFSCLQNIQTDSDAHSDSDSMVIRNLPPVIQQMGCEDKNLPTSSAKIWN